MYGVFNSVPMFSIEYFNCAVIITAYNIRRIDFRHQSSLKELLMQALNKSCDKIILNLVGVRQIDEGTCEMLSMMRRHACHANIGLYLLNVDGETVRKLEDSVPEIAACISRPDQLNDYVGLLAAEGILT